MNELINRVVKYKHEFAVEKSDEGKDEAMEDEDSAELAENITLGDPRLLKMTHLNKPYAPYPLLKQAFCVINKGYTVSEYQKDNKEKTGPSDALKLYMRLSKEGTVVHESTCTA